MPWTGPQFAAKHNKKLKGAAATKAAKQATAMINAGVPEGEAIATANKQAAKRGFGVHRSMRGTTVHRDRTMRHERY